MSQELTIEAQADHLEKVANAKPIAALSECIWNSLDADCRRVDVQFFGTEISVDQITVVDDGDGFSHAAALNGFGKLGGSWKKTRDLTPLGRKLHGKEGQGRFKVFSLGNEVKWTVRYKDGGTVHEYTIVGKSDRLDRFVVSDPVQSSSNDTGVRVEVRDIVKQFTVLQADIARDALASVYAPYLFTYKNAEIYVGLQKVDPSTRVERRTPLPVISGVTDAEGRRHSFDLELLEWSGLSVRELYLCDENGFPLKKYEKQIRGIGDFNYTGYLRSSYFTNLANSGELELAEMNDFLLPVFSDVLREIKSNFIERTREKQKHIIQRWKDEEIYPYKPRTTPDEMRAAEEKVFDILALNLNDLVEGFDEGPTKQKKLQFRLLQQAIETNPGSIRSIIEEVISLPEDKASELAELLESTTLSSLISTSKKISDRLKFVVGFEEIVYEATYRSHLKERSQIHRILADNPWFFGEEFSLAVDDMSLTEVLRKYLSFLDGEIKVDEPVKRIDGSVGIIDLMLSRSIPMSRAEELEFLVVELKAPKVLITNKEISQIESYAFAVAADERFRGLTSRWEFWIISNDMDDYAKRKVSQRNLPKGTVFQSAVGDENDITIKIKTWSEVIAENKHRHKFVKESLDLTLTRSDGLAFLQKKYAEYLKIEVV